MAAVAKPPIVVIKCNGPFACSHLLCSDAKEKRRNERSSGMVYLFNFIITAIQLNPADGGDSNSAALRGMQLNTWPFQYINHNRVVVKLRIKQELI